MNQVPLYEALALAIDARTNANNSNDTEWLAKWTKRVNSLAKDYLPSGSGIDQGTWIDIDMSHAEKIVMHLGFHHMDGNGFYDGWIKHTITATPSFRNKVNL
jgi:hypothetical protein